MLDTINTSELLTDADFKDVKSLGNDVFEISSANKNFVIEVLKIDVDNKSISIRHRHFVYDIEFKNDLDLVLDKMGIKRTVENVSKNVKAPMPGKVIEVIAKEGDQLQKGDGILILEAMKMENVIKAESACTIKKILINNLQNVEKNQILIELETV